MAYLRTNFKTLNGLSRVEERAKNMYKTASFLCAFERYYSLFKDNKGIELLKEYAEKIYSLKDEFSAKTLTYASNMLKFINSLKTGKLDIDSTEALADRQEWEYFCIGALNQIRKEFLFDSQDLQLL